MGEISRDSKNIHDGVFFVLFFPPWNFSDETEIREAYVPSAYVHFVVFRFVGDVGGKFVTVGWKSRVREDTFRLVVWVPGSSSDRHGRR